MSIRNRVRALVRSLSPLGLLLVAASCGKSSSGDGTPTPTPTATATLRGVVYSLGGAGGPLSGASVSSSPSAGAAASTNALGQFTLSVPAGSPAAVTASRADHAPHPALFSLTQGDNAAGVFTLLPIGITLSVGSGTGGKVTHNASNTAITLPSGFLSAPTLDAQVKLGGLDPTTVQSLAMPGTFAAENLLGAANRLRPVALAYLAMDDISGKPYTLTLPGNLELPIPAAMTGLAALAPGAQVPCFRHDAAAGVWKAFAFGTVVTSSVNGQPAVKVALDRGGWIATGLLYGGQAHVAGVVFSAGLPAAGVDVQAYPGGVARTDASGAYDVPVPPDSPIQLVAVRGSVSTVEVGSRASASGAVGSTTPGQNFALQSTGGSLTYTVRGQLMRGRDGFGVFRDEALVRVVANTSPSPLPVDGALVEINSGSGWVSLPAIPSLGAGTYGRINGVNGSFSLATGANYQLRVDIENDGASDVSGSVIMPGRPDIDTPTQASTQPESFTATWTDPANGTAGYAARYVGSFESTGLGVFPARFVVLAPDQSKLVGDGIPDDVNHMPNDPLFAGEFVFRLWATNGPIEYPVPGYTLFASPNLSGPGVIGWFSAIAQADSVVFNSLGSGEPGPTRLRREWGPPTRGAARTQGAVACLR